MKKLFTLLSLFLCFASGAWAIETDGDGYYLLSSVQDWKDFATLVQTTPTANAKMTADIDLGDDQTHIGYLTEGAEPFYAGVFDGQGHTLTVHYVGGSNQIVAPFTLISGATIKNLHVAGSIQSSYAYIGVVGMAASGSVISNVWMSATMSTSQSGWVQSAAIAGYCDGDIQDCLFTGTYTSNGGGYMGGFYGYTNASPQITNCLSTGTFSQGNWQGNGVHTNCYLKQYPTSLTTGCSWATDEALADGTIATALQAGRDEDVWVQDPVTNQPMLKLFATLQQDSEGYYLLGTAQNWKDFAAIINNGTNPAANAKMTADIDLGDDQTHIGDNNDLSYAYRGVFDGQGHKLNVNYYSSSSSAGIEGGYSIAPFRNINGATIKNFAVTGNITGYMHCAGVVGYAVSPSTNLINNVTVSANITILNTHGGGFIGHNESATTTIQDCLFNGTISGGSTVGVFFGWSGKATMSLINCLENGSYTNCSTLTPTSCPGYAVPTVTNCYYAVTGSYPGTQATSAQLADGTIATALQNGRAEEVWVQDPLTNQPMLKTFASLWQDGEETYCIGSDAGWTAFANGINDGTIAISANAKLMADNITVTTMIGNSGHRYAGTFDGNNKTITLSISGTSGFEAPFSYINGATIKDLTVSGTLSGGIHCSGLIGLTNGTNNVNNVIVDCAITATGSHCSGLLGRQDNGTTTLNGCAFTGSISKASGNCNVGVLWGWSNGGTAILTNCLENGTYTNCSPLKPVGNLPNSNTVTNTFYVSNVSSSYGTRIYTSTQDGEVNGLVTAVDGNNYYAPADISGINERYELLSSSVSPEPVVKFVGTTLTKDADYTVSYSNNTYRGTGSVIITGAGSYSGTKTVNFAVAATTLSGSGTEESPFIIGSDDDWTEFAASVNSGFTFSGMYVKMTDNVNASSMAGQYDSEPFSGTFDGDHKTLNLSIVNSGSSGILTDPSTGTAPFHYIKNAVIKDVKTTGSVSATSIHASGLVGLADGTNTILGCTVSATINTTSNYVGGVLAHGIASNTTIQDCTFNGTINGSSGGSSYVAGLYGWSHGGSSVVKNSLENGTYTNVSTFNPVFLGWQGGASVSGTYYLNGNGDYGTRVYTALPDGEMCGQVTAADGHNYYALTTVSGINERYQLLDESVTPVPVVKFFNTTLTQNTDYTVSYSDNTSGGTGSVIITGINDYTGTKTVNFEIAANTLTGSGTEGDPYVISSDDDWTSFANSVNSGFTYSGEFVKLTKNVNASVNVGLRNNEPFSGTFDGDGHTLTVTLTANAASTSGNTEGIAPFHFIRNATIKNLRTAGTITSTTNHTSGLVGFSEGTNTFQNCVVSTTLNVKYFVGGFIGHSQSSSITIRDCLFNGTVNGSSSTYIAGIWGWKDGGSGSIVNCLENGTYTGVSSYDAIGWTPVTPTNTYRMHSSTQGIATTIEALADGTTTAALQNGRAETIWAQDEFTNSPMPAVFANTMIYKVPSSGLGTFSAKTNFTLPEGLEAYTCKTYDSGKSTISTQKVEGTIPANTGVLMKGIGGETYTLVASSETPEAIEGNALIAVVEATHVDQTVGEYTNFMMSGGKFVKIAASSNPDDKMPANRAYLPILTSALPAGSGQSITVNWDEETGVKAVRDAQFMINSYYTLDGRKLNGAPSKGGVYINNGKKVIK